ncbi:hypothetical protein B0H14DRAFT_3002034, partial [Mycena olivaceomarginata]
QPRRPFCIADAAFVASLCTTAFLGAAPPPPLDALLHPPHGTTTFPSTIRIRSTRSSHSAYPPPPGSASRPPRPSTSIPMRSIIAYAG